MFPNAGDKYIASNRFNALYWTIALLVAFFIAIGIGRVYAIITLINPLIYLNFVVLAGAAIALGAMVFLTISIGKSRNRGLNVVTGVILCYSCWAAHWAHIKADDEPGGFWLAFFGFTDLVNYTLQFASHRNMAVGRIGSKGMGLDPMILFLCYLVEFVAFMAPAYLVMKTKNYFCEACETDYTTVTGYISEDEVLRQHTSEIMQGDLTFLKNNIIYNHLQSLPLNAKEQPNIGAVELHYCKKCNTNAIVNLNAGILKQDDKQKREMSGIDRLMEDTYITEESRQLLAIKLGLA